MEDLDGLAAHVEKDPIDAAFHLAWSGVTGELRNSTDPAILNMVGSLRVWEMLSRTGCKAFITVGSQAEYGRHSGVLREDLPACPETVYGSTKLSLNILLKQLCAMKSMRLVWMRLISAYGPADDERHMVPRLIRALLKGERPALTQGEQIWDYLYATDVAEALCQAMEQDIAGVFNLGSGTTCVLKDFVTAIRDRIDPSLPLGFGDIPYRPDQVMHLEADISHLKAATGWAPRVDLTEGIRRTVEWYTSHCETSSSVPRQH